MCGEGATSRVSDTSMPRATAVDGGRALLFRFRFGFKGRIDPKRFPIERESIGGEKGDVKDIEIKGGDREEITEMEARR